MAGYLVCEDGPEIGLVIPLDAGTEWIIGRDPGLSQIVLEDPMVSRKHARVYLDEGVFFLENLSDVNPTLVNGDASGPFQLQEDDTVQVGNNYFRFTEFHPEHTLANPKIAGELPSILPFTLTPPSRFFLKVLAGPNQGAEFGMNADSSYLLGKEASCDVVFQDLSVSHKHARLLISSSGEATIEDLNSRNGVIINGLKIDAPTALPPQGVVSLGTTVFLFIDREASEETIYAPPPRFYEEEKKETREESKEAPMPPKDWKETIVPTKHLVIAGTFLIAFFVGFIGLISLFKSEPLVKNHLNDTKELETTLAPFPSVQYSFNPNTGKVFLIGHVLTDVDYAEMVYLIKSLPFIEQVEDTVVVDEGVWQEMNALLSKNPNWRGIIMSATKPGRFVLRGYLRTEAEAVPLQDYINLNFPYVNLLDNQVVIENTLQMQVTNLLVEQGFMNTELELTNGEVILSGRVNEKEKEAFIATVAKIQEIPGVRQVKNFVLYATESTSRIDITSKYRVMGSSKLGNTNQYVLISGKILTVGDTLDGMTLTDILPTEILLDKNGIKYKIDYNQQ